VVAVANRTKESAEKVASQFSISKVDTLPPCPSPNPHPTPSPPPPLSAHHGKLHFIHCPGNGQDLGDGQKFGLEDEAVMQATGNWRELIDDLDIDAIVIGTWPYLHRTLTIAALRAGKHVLTEARMVSHL